MRLTLGLGSREHDVILARKGDHLEVEVDGEVLEAEVTRGGDATTVTIGDETFTIELHGDRVVVNGEAYELGVRDVAAGQAPGAGAGAGGAVKPPMPGKIVGIKVKVGDEVTAGQTLIILEAMKMQNEIPAPSAGTVKEIKVEVGKAVETKDVLVVLE